MPGGVPGIPGSRGGGGQAGLRSVRDRRPRGQQANVRRDRTNERLSSDPMSQLASRKLTPSCNMQRQRRPSRASIVVSYTYSTIFEDEGDEGAGPEGGGEKQTIVSATVRSDDYSVSEMSETFTIVQKGDSIGVHPHSEGDTDIEEEDDGFDEYSEVTFEKPSEAVNAPVRARKNTVLAAPEVGTHSHGNSKVPCRWEWGFVSNDHILL